MNNIGFGCVRLTSNFSEKQAINNLEVAFENGITHFDVARLYGFGLAEGILGKFAKGKRDKITITTKCGLFPNNAILRNLFLQNILRSVFRVVKKLPVKKSTQNLAGQVILRKFSLEDTQKSLKKSLEELSTDYVDYLLLHEADIYQANSEEIINFLEIQKSKGVIRAFGIGSFTEKILDDFSLLSENYTVLQTDNSFPNILPANFLKSAYIKKRFYFSPFRNLKKIQLLFAKNPAFSRLISNKLDFDVKEFIIDLFLIQQMHTDPEGTFLFASSNNKKIKNTIERWNHVKLRSSEEYKNFEEVRDLIKEKLDQNVN